MYEDHTIGVVVPAYNEAPFVGDVIATIPSFVDRVYAIDDCSSDETFAEMRRVAADWNDRSEGPTVRTTRHDRNRGVGGAIKTGYLQARDERTDVTVVVAGDGQMELEILDQLVDPIVQGDADYVKANRFLSSDDIAKMPAHRRVGNRILDVLTRVASGYWETGDPQSGYTAISLDALEAIDVEDLYEYYGYCNELLVRLNASGCRVVDVPRPVTYGEEDSGIDLRSYVPFVSAMLLRNFLWRLRARYLSRRLPDVPALYAVGGACVSLGVATLLSSDEDRSTVLRPAVQLPLGLLSTLTAMALDRQHNAQLNGQNPSPSESEPTPRNQQLSPTETGAE